MAVSPVVVIAPHPHGYAWHDGHTDHHRVSRNLSAIHAAFGQPVAKADPVDPASYARSAAPFGNVTGTPNTLKHYPYEGKAAETEQLMHRYGFRHFYAHGQYGSPDLSVRNYNNGHLMIPDPGSAGQDAGARGYTDTWRKLHELAHGLTAREVNSIHGEGRRTGRLGRRTVAEGLRALHWEDLAVHRQRELGKEMGVHISDQDFNRERNTVLHDAVHRVLHGKEADPVSAGFVPHDHHVPLSVAMDMVRDEAGRRGLKKGWPKNLQENSENKAAASMLHDSFAAQPAAHPPTRNPPTVPPGTKPDIQVHTSANPAAKLHNGPTFLLPSANNIDPTGNYATDTQTTARIHNNETNARLRTEAGLGEKPSWPHSNYTEPSSIHGFPSEAIEDGPSGPTGKDGRDVFQRAHQAAEKGFWENADAESQGKTVADLKARAAKRKGVERPVPNKTGKHPIDVIGREHAAHTQHQQTLGAKIDAQLNTQRAESDRIAGMHKRVADIRAAAQAPKTEKAELGSKPGVRPYEPMTQQDSANMKQIFASIPPKGAAAPTVPTGKPTVASPGRLASPKAAGVAPTQPSTVPGYNVAETKGLQAVLSAAPRIPGRMGKSEPPVILPKQGNSMSEKTYTPAEAVEILKKAAADKIKALEGDLQVLRKREMGKAMIPPHAHNTGSTVSVGTEDVPPGKLGKDELCKDCGKAHEMDKGCMGKNALMGYPAAGGSPLAAAELTDAKGKHKSNSEVPSATMPSDGSKKVGSKAGTGGKISLGSLRKSALEKAQKKGTKKPPKPVVFENVQPDAEKKNEMDKAMAPPTAKPPSGVNMGTKIPTSAPKTPAPAMAKPMGKGVMSDIAQQNSPPVPKPAASTIPAKMPTPDQHAVRAAGHQAALAGAFQPQGPVHSGLDLASPKAAGVAPQGKPGVFGRLAARGMSGQK